VGREVERSSHSAEDFTARLFGSRFDAGVFGFFDLSHSGERPER
jgi:hypothetical protein